MQRMLASLATRGLGAGASGARHQKFMRGAAIFGASIAFASVCASHKQDIPPADRTAVFSFGSGQFGQLGLGEETNQSLPQRITMLDDKNIKQIACGAQHTALLTYDGNVFTFGNGRDGRLGHGDDSFLSTPCVVEALDPHNIVQISSSEFHMAAISDDGKLFTWGKSWTGQLGRDTDSMSPGIVESLSNMKIKHVACGRLHTIAITEDDRVFGMGSAREGQLGIDSRTNQETPVEISALANLKVHQAACGHDFSILLTESGNVWSMGANDYGQIGQGSQSEHYVRTPRPVKTLSKVVQVAAGEYHAAALTESGQVWVWGFGKDGQIGNSKTADQFAPQRVKELEKHRVVQISCGGGHTAAVTEDGNLYIFGRGRDGQLGRGDMVESVAAQRNSPVRVEYLVNRKYQVTQVSLGGDHSVVNVNLPATS